MSENAASPRNASDPERRRRPRLIGNDVSGLMVDLQLPEAARRRRVTLANVSAVCEQLGEHVSTRNVQRVLGGSLRDIGPLVQAWRANRAAAGEAATVTGVDQAQAMGAILMAALQDHGAAVAAALQDQAVANAATQQALLERVERLLHERLRQQAKATRVAPDARRGEADGLMELRADLQALRSDVGHLLSRGAEQAPAAIGPDLAELGGRIDRLAQAVDQLQTEQRVLPPDSVDATIASALSAALGDCEALLAPVVARLDALASILATAAVPPAPAPDHAPALGRIEACLGALAAPKPLARAQPSKAIITRLDALLATTAELPAQLKAAVTPPKRKRKTAPVTTRKSAAKKLTRRTAKSTAPKKSAKPTRKATAKKAAKANAPKKSAKPARKATAKKAAKNARMRIVRSATGSRPTPTTRSPRGSTVSRRKQTSAVAATKKSTVKLKNGRTPARKAAARRKAKK